MTEPGPKEVAKLVRAAGGEIIGRTRLQKVGCLLELAGAGLGFKYSYHLYGPYSEQLSIAASDADALNMITAEERQADWGGRYFVFRSNGDAENLAPSIQELAQKASAADSIELELAVTAAFLAKSGNAHPWDEVSARKKAKATPERLVAAKALYATFESADLPTALPHL